LHKHLAPLAAAIACLLISATPACAQRPVDFGQRWVRTHPLTLMGLQQWEHTLKINHHLATNMSNMLVWWADGNGKPIAAASSAAGLPWHALIVDGEGHEPDRIADYATVGNAAGWMVGDELARSQFPFFADIISWIKQNRPNDLAYTNAFPTYAPPEVLYGGPPPGGSYSYHQYLEDMVAVMKPDILMYDHYPFVEHLMRHDYFFNMMEVRSVALEHNLPYWGFMLSSAHGAYRLPSLSDARFQMNSHLAAGFTGMAYFTFDNFGFSSILNQEGNPSPLYYSVVTINQEAQNLGEALRFMTSTGVNYVAGSRLIAGSPVKNPVPLGMGDWSPQVNPVDRILDVRVEQFGAGIDGLIGFFTDDAGDEAFMIMNAYHGGNVAQFPIIPFSIQFDSTVTSLLRLDRVTGEQVRVPLIGNRLTIDLAPGAAELYKFDEGDFIVAVPEPSSLGFAATCYLFGWRSRRNASSRNVYAASRASSGKSCPQSG
jgi:hypothetical protein